MLFSYFFICVLTFFCVYEIFAGLLCTYTQYGCFFQKWHNYMAQHGWYSELYLLS